MGTRNTTTTYFGKRFRDLFAFLRVAKWQLEHIGWEHLVTLTDEEYDKAMSQCGGDFCTRDRKEGFHRTRNLRNSI